MTHGWAQQILTEVTLPGAVAQIVESHYEQGGSATSREADIMLRWRLWPNKINVQAWQQNQTPGTSGQLMFIPADVETVAIAPEGEDTRSLSLRIKPSWLYEMTGTDSTRIFEDPRMNVDFRDDHIEQAMRRMSAEMMAPGLCSRMILEACGLSIAADLARHFDLGRHSAIESKDILTQKRIRRIEEFVMDYVDGCPTLAEIAGELGIGVGYLRQVYKNTTGKTLFKFIEEVRILRAQSLLSQQTIPLKVVSHQLGFCTPSAFSLAFRKATGLTPREYRLRAM